MLSTDRAALLKDPLGQVLNSDDRAIVNEVVNGLVEELERKASSQLPCAVKGCEIVTGADDFLCRPHWQMVPDPLRMAFLEAYRAGEPTDRGFLTAALAYISLEAEKIAKRR